MWGSSEPRPPLDGKEHGVPPASWWPSRPALHRRCPRDGQVLPRGKVAVHSPLNKLVVHRNVRLQRPQLGNCPAAAGLNHLARGGGGKLCGVVLHLGGEARPRERRDGRVRARLTSRGGGKEDIVGKARLGRRAGEISGEGGEELGDGLKRGEERRPERRKGEGA